MFNACYLIEILETYYTREEYLQHIEARVTFLLGLQPTTDHEYIILHARRKDFSQRFSTGTTLSWYISLHDTYKQDLYNRMKNIFHHRKHILCSWLKPLILSKLKQFVILPSKFNNWFKKAGVMRMHQQ